MTRFARFAWGLLAYDIGVAAWGAYVRATGSGAGCGRHWPLCNGEVMPRAPRVETLVELSHRLSSGTALLLTVGLLVWSRRSYPRGHCVRAGATAAMTFMVTEAGLGDHERHRGGRARSHAVPSWIRPAAPHEKPNGEQERSTAGKPMRKLDQRLDPWCPRHHFAVAERPMPSAACARSRGAYVCAPGGHANIVCEEAPGEASEPRHACGLAPIRE